MQVSVDEYVYMNQIFFYFPPLVAMPVAYLLDRYNLRRTMYVCIVLIAIRNFARVLLFLPHFGPRQLWLSMRFVYWFVANFSMGTVVVLYYCLPLKVSEDWFPREERSLAWTCIGLMPILGTALNALTVPHYVSDVRQVNLLAYMQIVTFLVSALAILIGITKSRPATGPPSERKAIQTTAESISMLEKMRRLCRNKDIWIHVFALHTFQSIMASINTVSQDLLKSAGLSIVFCGQLMASMNILSVLFQLISSALLERNNNSNSNKSDESHLHSQTQLQSSSRLLSELESTGVIRSACKRFMVMQCCAFFVYACALNLHLLRDSVWLLEYLARYQWILLIISSALFVLARSWGAPKYNEQSARMIAGSVTEATYSAATQFASCATQTAFSTMFVALRYDTEDPNDTEHRKHSEYWRSIVFVSVCAFAVTVVYVWFFDGRRSESTATRSRPH